MNIDEVLASPEWKQALKDALGFDPSELKIPDNYKNPIMECLSKNGNFKGIEMGDTITELKFDL